MYCIRCGVELADGTKSCPLCQLEVYHPQLSPSGKKEALYPAKAEEEERFTPGAILFVLTSLFVLAMITVLFCDLEINRRITWSGYVLGGILLFYSAVILPAWFPRPNPVIFFPIFFAVCICYLLYVDLQVQGGWFLSFAFPVSGFVSLLLCAIVVLLRYLKRGRLFIFGGAFTALGVFFLLVEFLSDITFSRAPGFQWAFYPLIGLCFIGGCILTVALCPPLKESLRKKLFL